MNFTLLAHLRLTLEVFAQNLHSPSELKITASHAVALLTETLARNEKEYWRATAGDLDLIFAMLSVADARGDWRSFLATARAVASDTDLA